MADIDNLVKQAIDAYHAGNKDTARTFLLQAIEQDERHEQAWLWLSAVTETLEEQQICLENVLAINPDNASARKGLETISQQTGSTGSAFSPFDVTASPPDFPASASAQQANNLPLPTSSPGDFGGDSGSTFDEDSFSWMQDSENQPTAPEPDPTAPATSVDWGQEKGPAAYGSGKQVELPSAQEYDDWVHNLNLGGDPPPSPRASVTGKSVPESFGTLPTNGPGPFSDTSFMVDAGPFASETPGSQEIAPDLFRTGDEHDVFSGSAFEADANQWDSTSPFTDQTFLEDSHPSDAAPAGVFGAQESAFGRAESGFDMPDVFTTGEPDLGPVPGPDSAFGSFDAAGLGAATNASTGTARERQGGSSARQRSDVFTTDSRPSAGTGSASLGVAQQTGETTRDDYFQLIPREIEAAGGGLDRESLLLIGGIVLLVVLNLVSFGNLLL
jgi:hypothetical protein